MRVPKRTLVPVGGGEGPEKDSCPQWGEVGPSGLICGVGRVLKRTSSTPWMSSGGRVGWVEGRLKGGGRGRRNLERGKRREARRFFFFFSCARKENVCILGQVMRCLVYRLAQFRADLSKLRPEINKKTRRVVMRCGLLSLGQVCPTFRFTNLISKS